MDAAVCGGCYRLTVLPQMPTAMLLALQEGQEDRCGENYRHFPNNSAPQIIQTLPFSWKVDMNICFFIAVKERHSPQLLSVSTVCEVSKIRLLKGGTVQKIMRQTMMRVRIITRQSKGLQDVGHHINIRACKSHAHQCIRHRIQRVYKQEV